MQEKEKGIEDLGDDIHKCMLRCDEIEQTIGDLKNNVNDV